MLKKYVASKLPSIAKWCGVTMLVPPTSQVSQEALRLSLIAEETYLEQSGEYKRHQVFSKLIKTYPNVSKKELGLAIELAVRLLP
jgi:hypothetical protein